MEYKESALKLIEENRVLFPLTDFNGNITGVAGRNLKASPKYVRSGEGFFGNINTENDTLIIVEGYADAFLAQIYGYDNVICVSGVHISDEVLEHFAKLNKRIILFFDSDEFGQKSAKELLEKLKNYGIRAYNYRTDDTGDMIEYLRNGKSIDRILSVAKG
ncbi:MAG: toprim domain-containing protein [Clostridiales bacterium]|nr:toprim domain-containing protein [Clostridiales bacterium]